MKKIGLLCLALVLALGALGVGFAHWSQTIYVDTTVQAGEVCVGFTSCQSDDPCVALCDPGELFDPNRIDPGYDKNVAGCWCELDLDSEKGEHNGDLVYERASIYLCNGYPFYTNNVTFTIANGGTIPVKLESAGIDWDFDGIADEILVPCQTYDVDLDNDGNVDINLHVSALSNVQLDPCDTDTLTVSIHVKQSASQDTTYGAFGLMLTFTQWNLVP